MASLVFDVPWYTPKEVCKKNVSSNKDEVLVKCFLAIQSDDSELLELLLSTGIVDCDTRIQKHGGKYSLIQEAVKIQASNCGMFYTELCIARYW